MLTVAWYPIIYWAISAIASICAIPSVFFHRRTKLATWTSPDRGIGTSHNISAEDEAEIDRRIGEICGEDEGDVVKHKQNLLVRIVEVILTALAWIYILLYVAYIVYGIVCLCKGLIPRTFRWGHFNYSYGVLIASKDLGIDCIVVCAIIVLVFAIWIIFNAIRVRFVRTPEDIVHIDVTPEEEAAGLGLPVEAVYTMMSEEYIRLERNIFPKNLRVDTKDAKEIEQVTIDAEYAQQAEGMRRSEHAEHAKRAEHAQ